MASLEGKDHLNRKKEHSLPAVDDIEGGKLLRLARTAIKHYLRDGKKPDNRKNDSTMPLGTGLFVTLWEVEPIQKSSSSSENPTLRGCIGHLKSDLPLYDFVQEVAISAATRDPRFPPLTLSELKTTRIEIAVLSPLRPITDLYQINLGQDGLLIEGLGKRGLLLPKVAVRMGWDQASFLKAVCNKAGLPLSCWPGVCNLFTFTTIVFDEGEIDQH